MNNNLENPTVEEIASESEVKTIPEGSDSPESSCDHQRVIFLQNVTRCIAFTMIGFLVVGMGLCYFSQSKSSNSKSRQTSKWDMSNPYDWLLWASGRNISSKEIVNRQSQFEMPTAIEIPTSNFQSGPRPIFNPYK